MKTAIDLQYASRFLASAFCAMCLCVSSLHSSVENNENLRKYNLVYDMPDILICRLAEQIGETWRNGKVWDKPLINEFYALLNAKKDFFVVLDIGAQTGCFTLLSKYFPNSQWYAFEPIQEAAGMLATHVQVNNINNVHISQVAVSDRPGSATLKLPTDSHWGLTTLGEDPKRFHDYNTRIVECIDLDTFVSKQKIDKVDFIKIDTEGWELFVLRGGRAMITKDKPTILMEFNNTNMEQCRVNPNDVLALLQELGYEWKLVSFEDLLCTPKK